MPAVALNCSVCRASRPPDRRLTCRTCGGSLEAAYAWKDIPLGTLLRHPERSLWKYRDLLPVRADTAPVTLGEGGTPLLGPGALAKRLDLEYLYFKDESANPTGSFKDRMMSVALTKAREFGLDQVVAASTGNTAVSASVYSAHAGLRCSLFVPEGTAPEKLVIFRQAGADVSLVPGNFGNAYERAQSAARTAGAFNVTTTYLNPYVGEGCKSVAYELFAELGRVPDWVAIPVGAGPLLGYCYRGFEELARCGLTKSIPKMLAAQAAGCAPIAQAFAAGGTRVKPWPRPETLAGAIADPLTTYPEDGTRTLRVVNLSGGCALAVGEEEIPRHATLLAEAGLSADPAAAVALGAVARLRKSGTMARGDCVIILVTGRTGAPSRSAVPAAAPRRARS